MRAAIRGGGRAVSGYAGVGSWGSVPASIVIVRAQTTVSKAPGSRMNSIARPNAVAEPGTKSPAIRVFHSGSPRSRSETAACPP